MFRVPTAAPPIYAGLCLSGTPANATQHRRLRYYAPHKRHTQRLTSEYGNRLMRHRLRGA